MQKAFHQDSMSAYTELCPKRVSNNCLLNLHLHQWEPPSSRAGWSRGSRKDCREVGPTPSLRTRLCLVDLGASASPGILPISSVHLSHTWNYEMPLNILLKFTLYFYILPINVCVEHMVMPSSYTCAHLQQQKPFQKTGSLTFFYSITGVCVAVSACRHRAFSSKTCSGSQGTLIQIISLLLAQWFYSHLWEIG